MNEKYTIFENNKVSIINEKGEISNRKFTNKFFLRDILLCENKIEILEKELEKLYKEKVENNKILLLCKSMLKIQPLIILAVTLGSFLLGGIFTSGTFLTAALTGCSYGLTYSLIICGANVIVWQTAKFFSKKQCNGLNNKIKKATELKDTYENDLIEMKSLKTLESSIIYKENEPISLENQNQHISSYINEELNKAYQKGYKIKK